jgi:hydrogenase maturation protease
MVAGIGNLFHGDDGFGPALARELASRPLPETVRVLDFGTQLRDLAYDLLEEFDGLLLLDATRRGDPPGTLSIVEPDFASLGSLDPLEQPHGVGLRDLIPLMESLGGSMPRTLLLGCEPAVIDAETEAGFGLSQIVEAKLSAAVELAESILEVWFDPGRGVRHA